MQTRWYIFQPLTTLKMLSFSYMNDRLERERKRKYISISTVFQALEKAIVSFISMSTLRDRYCLCFTSEKLLMLGKMKYLVYMSNKSKNQGHNLSPGCYAPNPCSFFYIPLHHALFLHVEESVSQSLPSSGHLGIRHRCLHPAASEPLTNPHEANLRAASSVSSSSTRRSLKNNSHHSLNSYSAWHGAKDFAI